MNKFYPIIEPYNSFLLEVDSIHQIYVEECGNKNGKPVIFLHGGPGGGCSKNDRRFFNPLEYRIILFDQRGCGRSLPHGCLENNESHFLIEDIEKIREKLNIDSWHVFGGSWGSTLSLLYAQEHVQRVKSLVLRGIFLGRKTDTAWAFDQGPAVRMVPDYWEEYLTALPSSSEKSFVKRAYEVLTGEDKEAAKKLAKAWSKWEISCVTLVPNEAFLAANTNDEASWTLARHEAHYMVNAFFIKENQILENCYKIKDIPTCIVHGRYDIVCPFDNAWLLHKELKNAKLLIGLSAGHASIEPDNIHHLIASTNEMLKVE
ncbi:MAG: prolyl aminopeptidase [Campylobacteraceae bacterium]|nr:prolyl aminopeptidase [Campylobacteraceae bacterium]